MATQTTSPNTGWVGWVYFAGILMLVRAFFQGFEGVVALTKNTFYLVTPNHLAVFNYTAWGWIHIVLSILLLTAAFSVLAGGAWGRIVGVIITAMSFFASLAFLPAYPIWGIVTLVIDAFIIYALVVHGAEAKVD